MRVNLRSRQTMWGIVAIALSGLIFLLPFVFILLTASKPLAESNLLEFSWPSEFLLWENLKEAISARDYVMLGAFFNSVTLTVISVTLLVLLSAMVGWIWARRPGKVASIVNLIVIGGLTLPPAVVPTIWVLQSVGLFKTMSGLVLVEVALGLPFCIILFRAFISSIPREIDEAAIVDGAGPIRLFFQVIFPMLRSVVVTVVILQTVTIYNDFENPLYFLPGAGNETIQMALFNFKSQFLTQYNLLFASVLLIVIPPLIMFILFNRKIVDGMTAGALKG